MINHVILLIKYVSFFSREENKPPKIKVIKEKFLKCREEEKKIATERKTLFLHYKKMGQFKSISKQFAYIVLILWIWDKRNRDLSWLPRLTG